MLPGAETERLARHAFLLEEFLAREAAAGRIAGPIGRLEGKVLLHGHCHQKAFGVMGSVGAALALVEGLEVETVESSCCGMAGAFGYGADTYAVSMAMGELTLLPAVRRAAPDTVIAADGFSCRHQIQRRHRPPAAPCRAHPAARPCRARHPTGVRNYARDSRPTSAPRRGGRAGVRTG